MLDVITESINVWTSAEMPKTSGGRGRSKNGKKNAHGIKKLRELILELAVRGKLVPQDLNDESASELLKKIAKEKERLIKESKIKKQKKLPEIGEDEKTYEVPNDWEWQRLGNLFDIQDNLRIPLNKTERALREGPYPYYGANGQVGVIDDYLYEGNRILVAEDGGFFYDPIRGVAYLATGKFWVNNHAHVLKCLGGTNEKYWISFFNRMNWEPLVRGMTRAKLNQSTMIHIALAVPPLAEQHRIVDKVDELMALCDQLEQEQTDNNATHQTLVETLLGTLTDSADNKELLENWSRIANHFDTLFTTEHSIDQLKQTILQLAVMGKLVSQDPDDEPASVLLEKIAKEKEQLIKKGKIKKQKPLPKISDEEKLFNSPVGWQWCRLQDMVHLLGDGLHGTPEYTPDEKYYFINGNNLKDGHIVIKPETKTVDKEQYDKYKKKLGDNTVFVSINGTLGNVAFYNNEEIVLGKSACYFNLAKDIYKQYMKVFIENPGFIEYAIKSATGSIIKNLGLKAMNSLPIALPPRNEQHRIVAKVDELMALCDNLKAQINNAKITQIQLADAIVEQTVT